MKTLVVLAHPHIENSRVNQAWKQEGMKYPDTIEIHELYKEYPDWKINVEKEQQLLESHDRIILQFPLYWYSCPPLLKKWMDDVFTHGWAYGSQGKKLNGRKFGIAVSAGDKKENYSPDGSVGFTMDEIITPFKASMIHVGAVFLPYFAAFGFSFRIREKDIAQSAEGYIQYVLGVSGNR